MIRRLGCSKHEWVEEFNHKISILFLVNKENTPGFSVICEGNCEEI